MDGGHMRTVNLAVIGLGAFGMRYLRSLQAQPGVRVVWGVDTSLERRIAAESEIPGLRTTDSMDAVCNDNTVDAVIIATPESAHRAVAVPALQAGKHVLVEKPLATEEDDARAMADDARQADRLLMTAFLLRFDRRYALLKARLPEIGAVRNLYAYRNFDRSLFELYSRTHSFIENAIHDIDLLLWYVGSPVVHVHGFCRNTLGLPNPDINWGILEFQNGALATLQTSWLYPPQKHADLQWNAGIQVMGDRGVLEVRYDDGGFRANLEDSGILLLDQSAWADIQGEPRGAFGAMLRHFLACVRGDTAYAGTSPEEAIESMRIARRLMADAANRPTLPETAQES
jgi:predicted dehydrogenase